MGARCPGMVKIRTTRVTNATRPSVSNSAESHVRQACACSDAYRLSSFHTLLLFPRLARDSSSDRSRVFLGLLGDFWRLELQHPRLPLNPTPSGSTFNGRLAVDSLLPRQSIGMSCPKNGVFSIKHLRVPTHLPCDHDCSSDYLRQSLDILPIAIIMKRVLRKCRKSKAESKAA